MTTPGWPFLVARGYETGYQLLLAPEFVRTGRESSLLMNEVHGEVPETAPPRTAVMTGPSSGPLGIVYRTTQLTPAHGGLTHRDRAGRPLVLAYGYLCRGVQVTAHDERDLQVAWSQAIDTYRRFLAAEMDFRPEASQAYAVRSTVAPVDTVRSRQAPRPATAAWTADALPARRRPAPARGRRTTVAAVLAAVLVVAGYLAIRGIDPGEEPAVTVPSVVNQPVAEAQRQVNEAGLVAHTVDAASDYPAGTVVRTEPSGGVPVSKKSAVRIWVSTGRASTPAVRVTPKLKPGAPD